MDLLSFQGRLEEGTLRTIALLALTSAYPPSLGVRAVSIAVASAEEQALQLPPPPGPATEAAAASASAYLRYNCGWNPNSYRWCYFSAESSPTAE